MKSYNDSTFEEIRDYLKSLRKTDAKFKIYFAGPWFTKKSNEVMMHCIDVAKDCARYIEVYFPRAHTADKPSKTFDDNVKAIQDCDMLIAFISEKDSGTAFEIGYAKALDKQVVLLCYNEDDFKSTTNIMLAFAADTIIPVSDLPKLLVEDIYTGEQIYINDDWKSNLQ